MGNENDGVVIEDAPENEIGPDNVISSNGRDGVLISGEEAIENLVAAVAIEANG